MGVYYALFGLIFALAVSERLFIQAGATQVRLRRQNSRLIALAILLVYALRSTSVGADLENYVPEFESGAALADRKEYIEIGYGLLSVAVRAVSPDVHVFLAVVAGLAVVPIAWVIEKTCENVYLSWVLFISIGPFAFMFSGLRQAVALGLVFATLPFLAQRRTVIPLMLVLVAATFHASALVFVPALIVYRMNLNARFVIGVGTAFIAIVFFGEQLLSAAIGFFYDNYEIVETGAFRWAVANALFWCALTPLYRRMCAKKPQLGGLYPLVLVGVLLLGLSSYGTNIVRVAMYYLQFFVILVPNALSATVDKSVGRLLSLVLVVLVVGYFSLTVSGSSYRIVPYVFRWEG